MMVVAAKDFHVWAKKVLSRNERLTTPVSQIKNSHNAWHRQVSRAALAERVLINLMTKKENKTISPVKQSAPPCAVVEGCRPPCLAEGERSPSMAQVVLAIT